MAHHRRQNRAHRNNRGQAGALNRLAAILERNATPPLAVPRPPYTIKQFTACSPPKYSGEDGATALLQWFEALENTFMISECPDELRVRYATTALTKRALTWWNTQKIIFGLEVLANLDWIEFKSFLLDEFCPENEMEKLEEEFSKLSQKGGDNDSYTTRFHELSLLVPHSVDTEIRAVQKYIRGLPYEIQNHVNASRPDSLSTAIRMAATTTDNCVRAGKLTAPKNSKREAPTETKTSAETKASDPKSTETKIDEPKRKKFKTNTQNYAITAPTPTPAPTYTYATQHPPRPNQVQAIAPQLPRKEYTGFQPQCLNCKFHHPTAAACRLCTKCNRLGHFAANCRVHPLLTNPYVQGQGQAPANQGAPNA